MFYLVKTPWWMRAIYRRLVWRMPRGAGYAAGAGQGSGSAVGSGSGLAGEKVMYLSFDDGPHPVVTPWVLDELGKWGAKATFFCIGKNVAAHPQIYRRILMEGHRVGNHTQDHLNGWKVDDRRYLESVVEAGKRIDSKLFRPPYGRIGALQSKVLRSAPFYYSIIMWDVLSGDFDRSLTGTRCARNVIRYGRPGSIVVFHDSEKAFERLTVALPEVLKKFSERGYRFEAIFSQREKNDGV
jgi:peptidoglycan-N-acetylglucosamine deacetylase